MKKMPCLLLPLFFISFLNGIAQSPEKAIENLRNNYSKEGIYIHYDKSSYVSGETIFFKSYVTDGISPSLSSTAVHVELLDDSGKVIDTKILPLTAGSAAGSFEIPRNAAQGNYLVRANTRRMMNFGNDYFYEQQVPVYNPSSKMDAAKKVTEPRIYFLPEGGDLIEGIQNVMAFKCTDQYGSPLSCDGVIRSSGSKEIVSFSSVHDGMGKINFTPKAGEKYWVAYNAAGKQLTADLPLAKTEGVSLQVQNISGEKYFIMNSERMQNESLKPAYLLGVMDNNIVLKTELPKNSNQTKGRLPLETLPSGILQLTLFTKNDQPLAERILFVNNQDFLVKGELITDTVSLTARGKNVYSVWLNDSLPGSFSVAVTDVDQDIPSQNRENIISRLLFSNEIKDKVYDPLYYFESDDKNRNEYLDLVMMTSGWRTFNWSQVLSNQLPDFSYADANYIPFAAKVYKAGTDKLLPNTGLTLIIETPDSYDAVKFTTDNNGDLLIPGMIFLDSAIIHSVQNQHTTTPVALSVYSLPLSKLFSFSSKAVSAGSLSFNTKVPATVLQNRYIATSDKGTREFIVLDNVKVEATKKDTDKEIAKKRYQESPFTSRDDNDNPTPMEYWYYKKHDMYIRNGGSFRWGYTDYYGINQPFSFSGFDRYGFLPTRDPAYFTNQPFSVTYDNKISVEGFSSVREFFSPDYSVKSGYTFDDNRSTIYWDPYLHRSKNSQKMGISFFNSDHSKSFRVTVTGMQADGKLLYIEKIVR